MENENEREKLIYLAKLACQAEKYDGIHIFSHICPFQTEN